MMKKTILVIFIVVVAALFVGQFFYFALKPNAGKGEVYKVTIEEGQNLNDIANLLSKRGLISSQGYFKFLARLLGEERQLKAGTYLLNDRSSIYRVIKILADINSQEDVVLTIPEGFTLKDIEERVEELIGLKIDLESFKVKEFKNDFDFLTDALDDRNLEGFIFPDTYRLKPGFVEEDLISKALLNFDRKLTNDLRQEIKNQKKSIHEIITMASLVEKEIPDHNERKIVSGILWKRLKTSLPLQVDASIAFILNKKTSKLTHEDLAVVSPYNTYLNLGLPPGPIANPGLDAIEAAIYPKGSPYWYYLSKPDGGTVFSKTLDEHNEAKARFLK